MDLRSLAAVATAAFNQLTSSSSTITTSVSSGNLPPLASANSSYGNVWSSSGRGNGLRNSFSLQDFSSFRKSEVEERDFIFGSSAGLIQTKPAAGSPPKEPTGYFSRTLKGSPNRSVPVTFARISKRWLTVAMFALLVCLLLGLTYVSFKWGFSYPRPEKLHYAIVLDCGSTGTRVHVYAWAYKHSPGSEQLPVVTYPTPQRNSKFYSNRKSGQQKEGRAYHRMETEPGLDKLLHNHSGLRIALEPLLQWAETQIPPSDRRSTPLFLLATAGLRRLPNSDAEWLLDRSWDVLETSPFMCRRSWVKVITGVEEAYYGWVALNYNLGRIRRISQQPTFGTLDLGGSSLQVTFETEEVARSEYGLNLSVMSTVHHLYAYSHAGFGLNDAFDRSVAFLRSQVHKDGVEGTREVRHPCLHAGYKQPYKCNHCLLQFSAEGPFGVGRKEQKEAVVSDIELVGEPNWQACEALAGTMVNSSISSVSPQAVDCEDPPCALGKHQPEPHGQFYALSGFFVVYKFFNLPATAHFDDLLMKGKDFCEKSWTDAQKSVIPQPFVEHYCFRAPYVVALLQEGLHLKDEHIVVGSGNMTWTLGAALLEAGALIPSRIRSASPRSGLDNFTYGPLVLDTTTLTAFLFVLLLLVLLLVACFRRWIIKLWRKQCVPLFTQQIAGSGSSVWLPNMLKFPARLGINIGANAVRNGDGRYKMPHSPAASGSAQDFHQQMFGSGSFLAGGSISVSESNGMQLPTGLGYPPFSARMQNPMGTLKVPHKGNSQLQSRRTQSRDDLHLYVGDNQIAKV